MSVSKCITIQWYGVRNISAARRLILTPSTMHLCWENFKQNYKNFWQDLHNIKKYDSKICIHFSENPKNLYLHKFQRIFFWISSLHKFQRIFFARTNFKGFFQKVFAYTKISFCSHKFLRIFQGISLLILSLNKYQMTFGFKSTVKVCFLIKFWQLLRGFWTYSAVLLRIAKAFFM